MKKFILLFLVCFSLRLYGQINVEWEALPAQSGSEIEILHQSKEGFLIASFPLVKKIMLSKDGARTWTEIAFDEKPEGYYRFVNDEFVGIYCFSRTNIFKLDVVKNVFKKFITLDSLNWVQDMAFGHDKIYVAASQYLYIYNFNDLSLVSSKKWAGNTSSLTLGPNNKNYAKTNLGGATYYWNSFDDDGANFKEHGKKSEIGEYYNRIFALNSGKLILVYGSYLCTSTDNGITWIKQNKLSSIMGLFVNSENEISVLNGDQLLISTNEGDTWENIPHPLKKVNYLDFWRNKSNQFVIKEDNCESPKLFFTKNKGKTWISEPLNLDLPTSYQIKLTPDKDVITNNCYYSSEIKEKDASTWKPMAMHDSISISQFYIFPSGKLIAYNDLKRNYFTSKDKGKTWVLYDKLPGNNVAFQQSKTTAQTQDGHLLYVDSGKKLHISKNEGENWEIIAASPEIYDLSTYDEILILNGYFFFLDNFFYTGLNIYNPNTGVNTQIKKINGKAIENPSIPKLLKKTKICFIASVILSSGSYVPYLYISSDLGTSFISKKLPISQKSELISFIKSTNDNLILLSKDNVYISYDEGDTWISVKGNLPSNIEYSSIAISNDEYVYVGMKGAPIYKTKLALTKTIKTDDAVSEIEDIRLSPNPTTGEINLQFADNQLNKSNVLIYSIEGKILKQTQFYGNNTTFDVQQLPKGMYLLQLKNGEKSSVKRFVKN